MAENIRHPCLEQASPSFSLSLSPSPSVIPSPIAVPSTTTTPTPTPSAAAYDVTLEAVAPALASPLGESGAGCCSGKRTGANARDRIETHWREMSGRVVIPDEWGREKYLRDWVASPSLVEDSLQPSGLLSARDALINAHQSPAAIHISQLPSPPPYNLSQLQSQSLSLSPSLLPSPPSPTPAPYLGHPGFRNTAAIEALETRPALTYSGCHL